MVKKVTQDLLNKTTPVDDDKFAISDSADLFDGLDAESGKLKRLSWANLKTTIFSLVDILTFSLTPSSTTHTPGRMRWNADEHTVDLDTDFVGNSIQLGQETVISFTNNTGATIPNGTVVRPFGTVGLSVAVQLVKADIIENITGNLFVTTVEVLDGAEGMMTIFGKIRGYDTSTWNAGDPLYVSPLVSGELTNLKPSFPHYSILMGAVSVSAVDGIFGVNQTTFVNDTFHDAHDGSFRETIDFTVTSDGATTIGSLENADGVNDLTTLFSDGQKKFDCTPACEVILTAGTASNPQINYIYITKVARLLVSSTSDWPTDEHIKVAYVFLRDATNTQTDGALINQNWNDHIKTDDDNGHILHITERIRQDFAKHSSGTEGSSTIAAAGAEVYVAATSGFIYQLHKQAFPALDTQVSDDVHIVNDFTAPYKTLTDIAGQTTDANGVSLLNRSFSIVLWGVQNKTGENSHLMLNMPTNSYARTSPDSAVSDAINYSVYDFPSAFKSTGFLIARFTYQLTTGGVWSLYDTEDLTGRTPNSTAGGGGGGTGVTSFTGLNDTPSSYSGEGGKVVTVNVGETGLEFTTSSGGGGSFDFLYPHSKTGLTTIGKVITNSVTYTPTSGKVLYITYCHSKITSVIFQLNGINIINSRDVAGSGFLKIHSPIIVSDTDVLGMSAAANGYVGGFEVSEDVDIIPIATSGLYTVPANKTYVISNVYFATAASVVGAFTIGGTNIDFQGPMGETAGDTESSMNLPLIMNDGDSVNSALISHSGYLVDTTLIS